MNVQPGPPVWAERALRWLSRPCDRDSIAGDLLEEYRASRQPTLGTFGADLWYVRQVCSILWRLIRPAALALGAQSVLLALTVFRPGHHAPHPSPLPMLWAVVFHVIWYGSPVGAPGMSMLDAAVYFAIAFRGARRTGLARTGVLAAAATSVVGFVTLFAAASIITPGLVMAALAHPSLLLILAAYLAIPLGYSVVIGGAAGALGRMSPRDTEKLFLQN